MQAESGAGDTSRPAWFAARTRSRFEFIARDQLRDACVDAWFPTRMDLSTWSDRKKSIERPLFPGYVFARFGRADVANVLQTRGIVQILGTGTNEYSEIDADVIENLKRVAAQPAEVSLGAYVVGETVRVERGPFAGIAGVITRVKNAVTLSIPVVILGRSVSVQIDAADVEKDVEIP